jgi:hypothetical protein
VLCPIPEHGFLRPAPHLRSESAGLVYLCSSILSQLSRCSRLSPKSEPPPQDQGKAGLLVANAQTVAYVFAWKAGKGRPRPSCSPPRVKSPGEISSEHACCCCLAGRVRCCSGCGRADVSPPAAATERRVLADDTFRWRRFAETLEKKRLPPGCLVCLVLSRPPPQLAS